MSIRLALNSLARRSRQHASLPRLHTRSATSAYDIKYADKLHQKAKQSGVDLDELKVQARQEAHRGQKEEAETAFVRKVHPKTIPAADGVTPSTAEKTLPGPRTDSSPIKPLSSILNVAKLLATPHPPSQISALWTAYHASRSGGTGRGYICASLPLDAYNRMTNVAKRYPSFVLPVPRQHRPETSPLGNTSEPAHEFFYLQWDFYSTPSQPSATEPDPFQSVPSTPSCINLPPVSTVLFTPLQEYKLREITPSAAVTDAKSGRDIADRYLLSQVDAQMLAMGLQEYYLWSKGKGAEERDSTAEELLRRFHERPNDFDWQELLKRSVVTT
ncbi:ATP11 protein-domain-containing protein [Pisolithus microcarpus]|nr:ATP11 protein-domain-containing protein [Pisolithus microcarpus]